MEIDKTNSLLYKEIPSFDFNNPTVDPVEFAEAMIEAQKKYKGYGIAANQLGKEINCCIIESDPYFVMYNPQIVWYSNKYKLLSEGCLSFPGISAKIKRHDQIRVRFQDPYGNKIAKTFKDLTARIVQHEVDHLNGKTIFDHMSKLKVELALKKLNKQKIKCLINT